MTDGPPLGPGAARHASPVIEVADAFRGLVDPLREIPDDHPVELRYDDGVRAVLDRLETDLVALREVKSRVREIAALLVVDRARRSLGLEAGPPTLHMCFTGDPGTGKTTVALRMGEILCELGYLRRGHLVRVTRDDLVGQFVGHTAPKTRAALDKAAGGVLFIDEAYHLYRAGNERDYGQEVVEMLLQVMEDRRSEMVVIMAGYADRMDRFFDDVPGLSSRIAHHIDFPQFRWEELVEIGHRMLAAQRYVLSDAADDVFGAYVRRRMQQPRFAGGRSVRNAVDRVRLRQAMRIVGRMDAGRPLTKRDLVTIEPVDVASSRVFDTDEDTPGEGS